MIDVQRLREQNSLSELKRQQIIKAVQRRKTKKKSVLYHRKIDKRKYYGVGVNITEYEDLLSNAIDLEGLRKRLNQLAGRESHRSVTESLVDNIAASLDASDFLRSQLFAQVGDVILDSFNKGSNRVFNLRGELLDTPTITNTYAVEKLMADQRQYIKNLSNDANQVVRDELRESLEEGEGIEEASDRIQDKVEGMSRNRAQTISRSEIIKASAQGTEQSMREMGVENVLYLATPGNGAGGFGERVCSICRALHSGSEEGGYDDHVEYTIDDVPTPVQASHPSCRCTICADL